MGFPSQSMPTVAIFDVVTAIGAVLHLGILPFDQAPSAVQSILATVGAQPSWYDRLRGKSSPAQVLETVSSLTKSTPPRGMLFIILAICLARCSAIFTVWRGLVDGISRIRSGGPSQDFSGHAIGYSAICVISMLANLFILNALFQTHGASPFDVDTSVFGILSQLNPSSLAAEQLMISAVEWILFVLFMGTNRSIINPAPESIQAGNAAPAITGSTSALALSNEDASTSEQQKKKDYGTLSQSSFPSGIPPSTSGDAKVQAVQSEAQPADESSSNDVGNRAGEASIDTQRNTSLTATTLQDTQGDVTPSDIMDIPSDRKQSMQDARDRLQKARENGKVRRRSLWKKIRGKASMGNSNNNAENES